MLLGIDSYLEQIVFVLMATINKMQIHKCALNVIIHVIHAVIQLHVMTVSNFQIDKQSQIYVNVLLDISKMLIKVVNNVIIHAKTVKIQIFVVNVNKLSSDNQVPMDYVNAWTNTMMILLISFAYHAQIIAKPALIALNANHAKQQILEF